MTDLPLQPLPVEQLEHPDARWLIAYWNSKTPVRGVPVCDTLLPHETRAVAPHLMALKPSGDEGELRYRRVGEAITSRFGLDLTGKALGPATSGVWAPAMLQAAAERRPAVLRGRVPGGWGSWVRFEALALPVACRDSDGTGVLVGLFFFDE
jgi:hypothetical protein